MPGKPNKKTPVVPPQQAPPAIKKEIPRWALPAILIFTALLYSNAIQNGLTYYDDDYYILRNPFIRDLGLHNIKAIFTTFYSGNYHPFTTLVWAVIYKFSGASPLPYHLLSVLLHLLNTWLVFKVAAQLSGKKTTALVVSLLFGIHPMHVESVAWLSELKDVLYAAFYLSSLSVYLQYIASGLRARYYVWVLLLFLASLFSKSAAVTLPVLLVAIDIYKGRKMTARSLTEKLPFFLLALLFGIINILSQRAQGAITDLGLYFNIVNRLFLLTSGISFYITKCIAPFGLCAMHYFPILNGGALPWVYYTSLPFLALFTWLVVRRSVYRKEIVFGVTFFLITISVMLQILSVGAALTAERYTYIPYIGLFYIAGQLISVLVEKDKSRNVTIGIFALIILVFSVQTWERISIWKDSDTLFTDVVDKNPDNGNICYIFWSWGNARESEGNLRGALQYFTQTIQINPGFDRGYCSRGVIYDELGDAKSAIQDYNKAIRLNPALADAYTNRGWAYYQLADTVAAMQDYNTAISLHTKFAYKDKYAETYNDRGWAYYGLRDTVAALRDFDTAIQLNPYFSRPYFNIAAIKSGRGDMKAAIDAYTLLLKHNPGDYTALYMRGTARYGLKDNKGACEDWNKAMELGDESAPQMLRQHCQ